MNPLTVEQLTLGEVIDFLTDWPSEREVHFGFGTPGPRDNVKPFAEHDPEPKVESVSHDQVSFSLKVDTTVGVMLAHAKNAIGMNNDAWKRGRYPVNGDTPTRLATQHGGGIPLTYSFLRAMTLNRLWPE